MAIERGRGNRRYISAKIKHNRTFRYINKQIRYIENDSLTWRGKLFPGREVTEKDLNTFYKTVYVNEGKNPYFSYFHKHGRGRCYDCVFRSSGCDWCTQKLRIKEKVFLVEAKKEIKELGWINRISHPNRFFKKVWY